MEINTDYKKVFSEVIEEVRHLFSFFHISEEEYDEIIMLAIKEVLDFKDTSPLELGSLYKEVLIKIIHEKIKEYLEKGKIEILLEYINEELKKSADYDECISYISKFITFLSLVNYTLTEKDIKYLCANSDILSFIIDVIINENKKIADIEIRDFIKKCKSAKELLITIDLINRYKSGEEHLLETLMQMHDPLVGYVARGYMNSGFEYEDLEQEGRIGLYKAILGFDESKNVAFSSFAHKCIKNSILMKMREGSYIRLPESIKKELAILKKATEKLSFKLNRKPTIDELSKETNLSIERIEEVISLPKIVYLSAPVTADGKQTLEDTLSDREYDLEEEISETITKENVSKALEKALYTSGLTLLEEYILRHRYGLFGFATCSQRSLAKRINFSQTEISRMENTAISKIKRLSHKTGLDAIFSEQEYKPKIDVNTENTSFSINEYLELSISKIKKILEFLSEEEQTFIKIIFGEELTNKVSRQNLSSIENSKLIEVLVKILLINKNKFITTIYDVFYFCAEERVDAALQELPQRQLDLINLKYSEDSEKRCDNLTNVKLYEIGKIIRALKIKLGGEIKLHKQKSLLELFPGYTLEQIKDAISRLDEYDRNLVYYKYGENLSNKYVPKDITEKQKEYFVRNIKKKILYLLENPEETYDLNGIFKYIKGYTATKVKEAISRLNAYHRAIIYLMNHKMEYLNKVFRKEQVLALINEIASKIKTHIKYPASVEEVHYGNIDNNILNELSTSLTSIELDILILKLINSNIFTTKILADMYNITEEEVISISKRVINMYRDAINKVMDGILYANDIQKLVQVNEN